MPIVERVTGFSHIGGVSSSWGGFGTTRTGRKGSLSGLGAIKAPSCTSGWAGIQKMLNERLAANGFSAIGTDGSRCCGRNSKGVIYGQTYNTLAWWVGPWKAAKGASASAVNIPEQKRSFLIEPPKATDVFEVQGLLALDQDGCLGPGTAQKVQEAIGAEWVNMPFKEVVARIKNPSAFTSGNSTATATATATENDSDSGWWGASFKPTVSPDSSSSDSGSTRPRPKPPTQEPKPPTQEAAVGFNFGSIALYGALGLGGLLILAKFMRMKKKSA